MNREDRRKLLKKGFTKRDLEILKSLATNSKNIIFQSGTKVKLKYDAIVKFKKDKEDYNVKKYLEFVEEHKDDILTLENYPKNDQLFTFEEDNNEVKFLFHEFELEFISDK